MNELLAYNIRVSSQTPHGFYGIPLPPVASLNDLDPDLSVRRVSKMKRTVFCNTWT
jgi:hypothetical protein